MQQLAREVRRHCPVLHVAISHRTGWLQPGDVSVAVAVSAPHRAQAFEAGRWLIDTLKQQVPIWKQENYADGRTEWVHPGVTAGDSGGEHSQRSQAIHGAGA